MPGAGGGPGDRRAENGKTLRTAADLNGCLPEASWAEYLSDPSVKARMLESVLGLGFALLREAPCREGQVLEVAETFGYARETDYGRLFGVRVEPDPNNLAFTGARITPHTGAVPLSDAHTELAADRPPIDVDGLGRIREVRFNNRSIRTLLLPADELESFYRAYRTFTEITLPRTPAGIPAVARRLPHLRQRTAAARAPGVPFGEFALGGRPSAEAVAALADLPAQAGRHLPVQREGLPRPGRAVRHRARLRPERLRPAAVSRCRRSSCS